jgi:SagB-type dehydrogenase family enzyme
VNSDTSAALRFHAATKYRVLPGTDPQTGEPNYVMGTVPEFEPPIWQEDWSLDPHSFKVYTDLPSISLPADLLASQVPALDAIADTAQPAASQPVGKAFIAHVARLSNGLLNRSIPHRLRGTIEFRTAGATGARYHLELYFVCGDLPDLEAGVYHYAAHDHTLRKLRSGDFRGALVAATGGEPHLAEAPVAVVMTSTFWRNAFRYRARAYRHTFWDGGTSLTNVLAVSASLGVSSHLVLGYSDADVNALLGVDGEREAAIAICSLGNGLPAPAALPLEPIQHATQPLSKAEVTFAEIPRMHAASCLTSASEAATWRSNPLRRTLPAASGPLTTLEPLDTLPQQPIEEVILGRRSRRRYDTSSPLPFELFSTVLDRSARAFSADCLDHQAPPLNDNYLIVNAVDGLEPGIYLHRSRDSSVELLRSGVLREQAAHLAFDQAYAGDAHVNSYYLAELGPVLGAYGNRGYRLAQLEAAIYAGRAHLAAEALGLGAVGSTSFDDEVTEFFSPRGAEASFMFITVFGVRRLRSRAPTLDP